MPKFFPKKTWLLLPVATAMLLLPRAADPASANYTYSNNYPGNGYFQNYTMNNSAYNSGYSYYGNSSSGQGNFRLTVNAQTFCVGQTPAYTVTAPSSWSGQTIYWTSSHNNSTYQQTYMLTGNNIGQSEWSASGNSWGTGDVGQWTKTAQVDGQTQSVNLTVQNCGSSYESGYNYNSTGYTGFGGSVGNGSQTIGGSVGGANGGTIGGSVGGSGSPTIGGSTNGGYNSTGGYGYNNYPAGSYVASNGYICSPPSYYQNSYQAY